MELRNLSWDIVYHDGHDLRELSLPVEPETVVPEMTLSSRWEPCGNGEVFVCTFNPVNPVRLVSVRIHYSRDFYLPDTVFCQGYQSWTQSREYRITERQKPLAWLGRLFNLHYYGETHFYRFGGRKGVFHGFHYGYVKSHNEQLDFIGSLDDGNGLTLLEYNARKKRVTIAKECPAGSVSQPFDILRLLFCQGSEDEVFNTWFSARGEVPLRTRSASGWTSWYRHYTGVTEKIVLDNLEAYIRHSVPADYFQIDDGYQSAVGDWLHINGDFPRGMKFVADRIHDAGFRAGIWVAPFVCEYRSRIMLEHPDWILKDSLGRPQIAGYNPGWSGVFYALDIYNPDFQRHLSEVFRIIREDWGFDLIKLDFLYAAALNPPDDKTRGGVMTEAMELLSSIKGDVEYLGCGVPLEPAFGRVEFCRIGSDVAPYYEDRLLRLIQYRERVSTKNSLLSTIGRRQLNRRVFINDPDVSILRKCHLSDNQKYTLFILNQLLGGLQFSSDNPDELTPVQRALFLSQFPLCDIEISDIAYEDYALRAEFRIGTRRYLLFSSLNRKVQHLLLPDDHLYYRAGSLVRKGDFFSGGRLSLRPNETCVFYLPGEEDFVVGDEGHIFPGSRFSESLTLSPGEYRLVRHEQARNEASVLVLADTPVVRVNGRECDRYRVVAGRRYGEVTV